MLQLAGARVHYIERVVRCLCLGIRLPDSLLAALDFILEAAYVPILSQNKNTIYKMRSI
jgi:hypothetical protein